jgi:hypothetical protein
MAKYAVLAVDARTPSPFVSLGGRNGIGRDYAAIWLSEKRQQNDNDAANAQRAG